MRIMNKKPNPNLTIRLATTVKSTDDTAQQKSEIPTNRKISLISLGILLRDSGTGFYAELKICPD
jgi:hypothetical protein